MFLLLFCRIYGHSTATYESASLRKYKFGRTDTIRSATIESDSFVRIMMDQTKKVRFWKHFGIGLNLYKSVYILYAEMKDSLGLGASGSNINCLSPGRTFRNSNLNKVQTICCGVTWERRMLEDWGKITPKSKGLYHFAMKTFVLLKCSVE